MVASVLRLKLTLLGNTFRRSPLQLVSMVLAVLYGLGFAVFVTSGLLSLRWASPEIAGSIVVVFGSLVMLAFVLLPLVFGVDDTVDPRRFSLFGIATGRLALALACAALISVPSLLVTAFAVAQVATWSRGPVPTLLAVVAAIVIVPTCVLAARVSSGLATFLLSSRGAREFSGILLTVLLAAAAPLVALLATVDWESAGLPILRRVAAIATWTPLGAIWSVPADAANGHPNEALAKLLISLAFLALLCVLWRMLVAIMLVNPLREAQARNYSGLGWFARLPATPTGAIAARGLTYWSRDARYRVALGVIPVVPIIMIVALVIGGIPWSVIAWVPVPVMCLFLGWTVHNDVAFDSTAFWTHVAASTRGRADRWGRVIPALMLGVPLVLVGSVVTVAISGYWQSLPGLIGLSACVLLVGLGISSVISAGFPYPVVRPGDSPFAQPQVAGAAGSVVQSLSFFATALSAAPVVLLVILASLSTDRWYWLALATGLGIGLAVLFGGVLWGGRILSRRAPELLAFTLRN